MKILIYGAGQTGEQIYRNIMNKHDVIGFLDGNDQKWGTLVAGVKVLGGPSKLQELEYDQVYIGSSFWQEVRETLINHGVPEERIVIDIPEDLSSPVRTTWLECYSKLHSDWNYAVAEGGVYRGDFASVINRCFPNSKLYLFDTFEGFDERDIAIEINKEYSNPQQEFFSNTSIELVLSKMDNKDMVEVYKGHFPQTANGIEDYFCFVNLDFDLYQPILEGLRFFYPKMIPGSVILIHDYYHIGLPGVKDAISDYENELKIKLIKFPIGDNQSIAIVKI